MKLENQGFRPDPTSRASQGDLLFHVCRLVGCVQQTAGKDDGVRTAAEQALECAVEAERRLAEQLERIAYLEQIACTDELTGVLNRRGFLNELERCLAVARRYGECGILIFADLDGFKPINDRLGHAAGDKVLRWVARVLVDNTRATDFVGRLGGDEFGVLLGRTDWDDGMRRAEALERLLNSVSVPWEGCHVPVRASFGIQAYSGRDDGAELLGLADDAMYRTKRLRASLSSDRAHAG